MKDTSSTAGACTPTPGPATMNPTGAARGYAGRGGADDDVGDVADGALLQALVHDSLMALARGLGRYPWYGAALGGHRSSSLVVTRATSCDETYVSPRSRTRG